MKKLIISIFLALSILLILNTVSAFQLEKHLIQTSVDDNYPCHIENSDTIVCPAIPAANITNWKNGVMACAVGCDTPSFTKLQKLAYLNNQTIPANVNGLISPVNMNSQYTQKVDINNFNGEIDIGFATNTFTTSGTPLENFVVNTSTGQVAYTPLNMTYYNFTPSSGVGAYSPLYTFTNKPFSISFWIFANSRSGNINESILTTYPGTLNKGFDLYTNSSASYIAFDKVGSSAGIGSDPSAIQAPYNLLNAWHNIVLTTNSTWLNITIDTVQVLYSNNISGISYTTGTAPNLGVSTNRQYKTGGYDELRVYNNTLSSSDILAIYNSGMFPNSSLNSTNLITWYRFNEFGSSWITDFSPSKINGTIYQYNSANWKSDNINVSTMGYNVNISIVNMTNAYVYWDNGTTILNSLDVNGNGNYTGNQTFTFYYNQSIFILDNYKNTVPPVITITSPTNGQTFKTTDTITLNFSAVDTFTMGSLWYTTNGGVTNITFTVPVTLSLNQGSNTITTFANDTDNNLASSSVSITIQDTTGCSSTTQITYTLIQIGAALLILATTIFYLYKKTIDGDIETKDIILGFIGIALGVALFTGVINVMTGVC
jgi:hypothetical protein